MNFLKVKIEHQIQIYPTYFYTYLIYCNIKIILFENWVLTEDKILAIFKLISGLSWECDKG